MIKRQALKHEARMLDSMIIPQTTVRYYDAKGVYREARFHNKKDLDAFLGRLEKAGCQVYEVAA